MTATELSATNALSQTREGGVLVVSIDLKGESVNKVSPKLAREFEDLLDEVEQDTTIRAVVLTSGKPDIFIAGADIDQFLEFKSAMDAERASSEGKELLDRLAEMRAPVVAAIHGACLGAGLEIALACTYRVVSEHPKTTLGLPEVQLGLIPGMGGTQRLPRLIGLQNALSMILEGRNVRARKALQLGLVHEMVHPAILREIAVRRATELAEGKLKPTRKAPRGTATRLLDDTPVGRAIVFRKARERVIEKTHEHYPAPLAALDVVRIGYEKGIDAGYREESRRFGELARTDVSRELIFLFYATTALKKDTGVEAPIVPEPLGVEKLAVLGAGFMGAGITAVAVQQGTIVRLKDTDTARVGKGLRAVHDVLDERLTKKQITRQQYDDYMALAGATTEYTGFSNVDLVVEAVFEDLALKQQVLNEVEPLLPDRAIYASNTSTIPITRIAEAAKRPARVLGMHFFSPVHKMPLLEIVTTEDTDPEATVTAVAYGKHLGKTVIVVNDGPGFYTTRTLGAYMNEAGHLLDEGATIECIDEALVDFGFPVGPITLLDEVGIDVGGKVGRVLHEAFGDRMTPSNGMRIVAEQGRTGRKGRRGFYLYDGNGKKGTPDVTIYDAFGGRRAQSTVGDEEIARRCVLAMLNEAARCLEEGILRSPRDGDVGAVFGIGFPPFRGGPFRYIDSVGVASIVRQLQDLHNRHAPRFDPAPLLLDMARESKRFYPARGKPLD
jgi:3-hydroxyacyl-CoA dehydrogenase / enoyl-CoA hydratase / 3-hydroxybutyryl-CoA epimerase